MLKADWFFSEQFESWLKQKSNPQENSKKTITLNSISKWYLMNRKKYITQYYQLFSFDVKQFK